MAKTYAWPVTCGTSASARRRRDGDERRALRRDPVGGDRQRPACDQQAGEGGDDAAEQSSCEPEHSCNSSAFTARNLSLEPTGRPGRSALVVRTDDVKTRAASRPRLRGARVRPLEGGAGEALEPRLVLRVRGAGWSWRWRCGPVAWPVWPTRPTGSPAVSSAPAHDARVEVGEVAVRPGLPVGRLHREAGRRSAGRRSRRRGRCRRRARRAASPPARRCRRPGSRGGVRDRDDRRAAADGEDVVAASLRRAPPRGAAGPAG